MPRDARWAISLVLLAASCAAKPESRATAFAREADTGGPATVFELIEEQAYELPDDAPDELLQVPDKHYARRTISLREGDVISAWSTTSGPDGAPSAMVYRCVPDGAGHRRWAGAPEAYLAPLGVDLDAYPDLLPFTATHTIVWAPGLSSGSAPALGFTIDGAARVGRAPPLPARSQLVGVEEVTLPGELLDDLPAARVHKTNGLRLGAYETGSFEHADYVLRLRTAGGAGPDGSCAPGEAEQRAPFGAEYWFVHMPFVTADDDPADADAF